MSLATLVTDALKTYSDELDRVVNTETVHLTIIKNSHVHALQRHKLELDTIVKWANEHYDEACQATDREYAALVTQAEDRIARLKTANEAIISGEPLKVAPEHEEPQDPAPPNDFNAFNDLAAEAANDGELTVPPADTFIANGDGVGGTNNKKPFYRNFGRATQLFDNGIPGD